MSDARAIKATFTEWRMVKTRKVLQLVLEVPLEQQEEVLTRLGPPIPDQEKWVAIALLDSKAQLKDMLERSREKDDQDEKRAKLKLVAKERYASLSPELQAVADAGRLGQDPQFIEWVMPNDAPQYIRNYCGIESRRDIATNPQAYKAFINLKTEFEIAVGRLADGRR